MIVTLKILLSILIFIHGMVHMIGFYKAFNVSVFNPVKETISKPNGVLWLTCIVLFLATIILLLLKSNSWWMVSLGAILISQYLIFRSWHDAKFGTITNVIILIATIFGFSGWQFSETYKHDVQHCLSLDASASSAFLTKADLIALPEPVQKYILRSGAVNKPKINNFKIEFTGQIRKDKNSDWMEFSTEQYNFIEPAARLFFMKAIMYHLPVAGYHKFINGAASMDIRLLSLFNVQYQSGKEMDTSETVTFFNDLCCFAPGALIDPRIKWLETSGDSVKATFTNQNTTVTAWLYFNKEGDLINFRSNDRYAASSNSTLQKFPWTTPIDSYRLIHGVRLPAKASTVYGYPDGDFTYGTFDLTNIEYNCTTIK